MLLHRYITQPARGTEYASLFALALRSAEFTSLDAGVAYATLQGVKALEHSVADDFPEQWRALKKRWLVGIDWCRTEPLALERLSTLPNSVCRIHEGRQLVLRNRCVPQIPFHPKTFVLHGANSIAVLMGSGNLSRNGLTRGHEVGSLLLLRDPRGDLENELWRNCEEVATWFQTQWRAATGVQLVQQAYSEQYARLPPDRQPTPTDEDSAETDFLNLNQSRRALTPEKLAKLRALQHLWIHAGNLHKNLGPGRPGNQLMLSPMTRVFFGFEAEDLDPDTPVGHVTIRYEDQISEERSLRFSNNSMDVLGLPLPGQQGPDSYDGEVLLFSKLPDGTFSLRVGDRKEIRLWHRASREIDAFYRMTSGRQWGVF